MKTILIHNPDAGGGDPGDDLVRAVTAAGHEVDYVAVSDDWMAAVESVDAVVVAGGDGTVRRVFKQLAGRTTPAAVLPLGTANNIARALGASPEAEVVDLARQWHDAVPRRFDLIDVIADGARSQAVESVGAGVFAELIHRGSDGSKQDKLRHGLHVMRALVEVAEPRSMAIEIDGQMTTEALLAVEAMNVGAVGPAVQLTLGADSGDGLLDIVRVTPEDRDVLARYAAARLVDQGAAELLSFAQDRGQVLTVRGSQSISVHVDDEVIADVSDVSIRTGESFLHVLAHARRADDPLGGTTPAQQSSRST